MDKADFDEAIRAMTFPVVSLIEKLVEKGLLSEAEALEIVDCSGSIDIRGDAIRAAHNAICQMTTILEVGFKVKKR